MESVDKSTFKVFSGTATRYLAEKICTSLDCKLGNRVTDRLPSLQSRLVQTRQSVCHTIC